MNKRTLDKWAGEVARGHHEKPKSWYVAKTGNHQGLIVDENGGANIAVAYDKADAPLIAAAPELLEALEALLARHDTDSSGAQIFYAEAIRKANSAIAKAGGAQ